MSQNYSPIRASDRVYEIDAVRGFALLGILMMNIMAFAGPEIENQFTLNPGDIYTGEANAAVLFFINTFVTANFYTMFSFLFGLGFFIFLSRAEKKGGPTSLLFIRRMLMLLLIGIIHAVFIWYGDILMLYAAAGVLLLLFYKLKPAINLTIAGFILISGTLLVLIFSALMFLVRDVDMGGAAAGYDPGFNMVEAANQGGYLEILNMNLSILGIMGMSNIVMIPLVLAMFLIGLYAGQKGYLFNLETNVELLKKVTVVGLGIGTPIKILSGYSLTYAMDDMFFSTISMLANTIGGPLMSLGYAAGFLLILRKAKGLTKLLQPVGQMALTNYIMQSVIMTAFFYGFNLYNTVDAVWFIPIVLTVFIIQTGISHLWMKRFKYGPLEWVWRAVTYGRIFPIRR